MTEAIIPINIAQNPVPNGITPNAFSTDTPFTQQNNQPENASTPSPSISLVAVCIYFLVGLLFSFPGFVLALIFVIVKKKQNKKWLLLAALIGVAVSTLIVKTVVNPWLENELVKKYPEMTSIPSALNAEFPSATFSVGVNFSKSTAGSSSRLTVTASGANGLTPTQIEAVGARVCELLTEDYKSYDTVEVAVEQTANIAFIKTSAISGKGATCEEWTSAGNTVSANPSIPILYSLPPNYREEYRNKMTKEGANSFVYKTVFQHLTDPTKQIQLIRHRVLNACQTPPSDSLVRNYADVLVQGHMGCQQSWVEEGSLAEKARLIRWDIGNTTYTVMSNDMDISFDSLMLIANQFTE